MSACRKLLAAAVVLLALTWRPEPAEAVVVERIVAVVGDEAILLSELRERGRPFLVNIYRRFPDGPQRTANESQMFKDLLEKMIEEELQEKAAQKARVAITPQEIDEAFERIAAERGMSLEELFVRAQAESGISEQDYRAEIRRQLLEGKMLQLRVKGRIRISEEAIRSTFERTKRDERQLLQFHPAWIVLRILPNASPEAIKERWELAEQLLARAKAGEDFAKLAEEYSDDTATKNLGGDLGIRAPRQSQAAMMGKRQIVSPELEEALMAIEPEQLVGPMRLGDGIVIVKLLSRQPSRYTTLDAAKNEMIQRLQAEELADAREEWLDELRRKTHVEVRL